MSYDYVDLGQDVQLVNEDKLTSVLLRGEEASQFLDEVNDLDTLWLEVGNPDPEIFSQYADHLDLLIEAYWPKAG